MQTKNTSLARQRKCGRVTRFGEEFLLWIEWNNPIPTPCPIRYTAHIFIQRMPTFTGLYITQFTPPRTPRCTSASARNAIVGRPALGQMAPSSQTNSGGDDAHPCAAPNSNMKKCKEAAPPRKGSSLERTWIRDESRREKMRSRSEHRTDDVGFKPVPSPSVPLNIARRMKARHLVHFSFRAGAIAGGGLFATFSLQTTYVPTGFKELGPGQNRGLGVQLRFNAIFGATVDIRDCYFGRGFRMEKIRWFARSPEPITLSPATEASPVFPRDLVDQLMVR